VSTPADDQCTRLQDTAAGRVTDVSRRGALGKYELRGEIGRGAMGVVLRAWDRELRREVAIKLLPATSETDADAVERFLREARTAASLRHPGIVAIHDLGTADGIPYFAMELVKGRTLREVLQADPPIAERVRLLRDVARAVAHAHDQRVIHRDLKPSNVLVDEAGRPRVTDFGLAKCLDDPTRLTTTGDVLGTPRYMAPEQIEGERGKAGPATDVYALGVMLYEALTGGPPFLAGTVAEMALKVLREDPRPPRALRPDLPEDLDTIAMHCLEKDPQRRYPEAGALAEDLDRHLTGRPILARPLRAPERLVRSVRRRQALLLAAAAALLGLLLAGNAVLDRLIDRREYQDALALGARMRAAHRPMEARDAFAKALRLRGSSPEARTGFDWANDEVMRLLDAGKKDSAEKDSGS